MRTQGCNLRLPSSEEDVRRELGGLAGLELRSWGFIGALDDFPLSVLPRLRIIDLSGNAKLTGGLSAGAFGHDASPFACEARGSGGGGGGTSPSPSSGLLTSAGRHCDAPPPALEELVLSCCRKLDGRALPASIGRCRRLRRIDLSGCRRLTGGVPASIGRLVALEELDLSYCESLSVPLGGVPRTIRGCRHLKRLDLSRCWNLEGRLPVSLGACSSGSNSGGSSGGNSGGNCGGSSGGNSHRTTTGRGDSPGGAQPGVSVTPHVELYGSCLEEVDIAAATRYRDDWRAMGVLRIALAQRSQQRGDRHDKRGRGAANDCNINSRILRLVWAMLWWEGDEKKEEEEKRAPRRSPDVHL